VYSSLTTGTSAKGVSLPETTAEALAISNAFFPDEISDSLDKSYVE
jgi:hypothetical protein